MVLDEENVTYPWIGWLRFFLKKKKKKKKREVDR